MGGSFLVVLIGANGLMEAFEEHEDGVALGQWETAQRLVELEGAELEGTLEREPLQQRATDRAHCHHWSAGPGQEASFLDNLALDAKLQDEVVATAGVARLTHRLGTREMLTVLGISDVFPDDGRVHGYLQEGWLTLAMRLFQTPRKTREAVVWVA